MPGTPRTPRVMSCAMPMTVPPKMPPWLLPSKNTSLVSMTGLPPESWKAVCEVRPLAWIISRASMSWFSIPWCCRSGKYGNRPSSPRMVTAVDDVVGRHAHPARGAEDEVVLVGHVLDVAGLHLEALPRSPWP